jgi:regulator of nucleoside diphosphate kinase
MDTIHITRTDFSRLRSLLEANSPASPAMRAAFSRLEEEIDRAEVMEPDEMPADVITLDAWARLLDLDSGEEMLCSPVLPSRSNAGAGRLSVLAPLGLAILGYRSGDTIEWRVPGGLRRLQVLQVLYQPGAHASGARADEHRARA